MKSLLKSLLIILINHCLHLRDFTTIHTMQIRKPRNRFGVKLNRSNVTPAACRNCVSKVCMYYISILQKCQKLCSGGAECKFLISFSCIFLQKIFCINLLHYICLQRYEKQRPEPCRTINIRQAHRATSCTST